MNKYNAMLVFTYFVMGLMAIPTWILVNSDFYFSNWGIPFILLILIYFTYGTFLYIGLDCIMIYWVEEND